MTDLGKQILKLREEGKSYREIRKELKCSSATISYWCGEGQRQKSIDRQVKMRDDNALIKKVDTFKYRNNNICKDSFNYKDVLKKFGQKTFCYLSGEIIDLVQDREYQLDHIIPASRGGDNSLSNLGVTSKIVNIMKHNFTVEEFLQRCKQILEFNNYKVEKIN